jgi:hypothetical protein
MTAVALTMFLRRQTMARSFVIEPGPEPPQYVAAIDE